MKLPDLTDQCKIEFSHADITGMAMNLKSNRVINVQSGNVPTQDSQTGLQAMMFQPNNATLMSGIVGTLGGGLDGNVPSSTDQMVRHPSPGLWSSMHINGLPIAWPGNYAYFRRVLADPTVRYVRAIAFAPILATQLKWESDKNAPGDAVEVLSKMIEPLREQYLDDAVRAIDFGWQGFENVYTISNGIFTISRIKPFLHEITSIFVTESGAFDGMNNNGDQIEANKSTLITYDGESGNLYGRGRVRNLLEVLPWWYDANEAASQYDRKIAGVFLVCHYPPGTSIDKDGKEVENSVIAQKMLDAVIAGKPIALCNEFAGEVFAGLDILNNYTNSDRTRWKLEILEDRGSRQPGFTERLAYLDKSKARGYLVPERAAFEAQKSGSRADSESMGDVVVTIAELEGSRLIRSLSDIPSNPNSLINTLLRMNWGEKAAGTVRCCAKAVEDSHRKFIREVVKQLVTSAPQLANVASNVQDMFTEAGLPVPTDPIDDDAVTVVFDDMVAAQVKTAPAGVPKGGGDKGKITLGRILGAMNRSYRQELSRAKVGGIVLNGKH